MASPEIPFDRLVEEDHDWNIAGNTMTAGVTNGAAVDVRSDGGGYWTAGLNNVRFVDRYDTLLWRAIRQLCNGGVVPIIVPCRETAFAPFPFGVPYSDIPHGDGAFFSDDGGYYQPQIDIVSGAADLRSNSLPITINSGAPLQGGEKFSIDHLTYNWRLYEIADCTMTDSTHGIITFNPPLREAVTNGTQLEFDQPRCTMKLVNAQSMDLNVTTYPFSLANVKFVESKYST